MVHIYIKEWNSFLKLRKYIREMKRVGLSYKLVSGEDLWYRLF